MQKNILEGEFTQIKNKAPILEATFMKDMVDSEDLELIDLKQATKRCNFKSRKTITLWEEEEGLPIKKASTDKSPHLLRVVDIAWLRRQLERRGKNFSWIDSKDYELIKPRDGEIEITSRNEDNNQSQVDTAPQLPVTDNKYNKVIIHLGKQNKKMNVLIMSFGFVFAILSSLIVFAYFENENLLKQNRKTTERFELLNQNLDNIKSKLSVNKRADQKYLLELINEYKTMIEKEKQQRIPYFPFWYSSND